MSRIKTATIPEQVAIHPRDGIASGRWIGVFPGRDLLAAELGVSSRSVQKATALLEKEWLLEPQGRVLNGQRVGEVNQQWSRFAGLRFPENEPALIIGQFVWGKTDEELDNLKLFRFFNTPVLGPMLIDKPAAVVHEAIAQEKLNAIQLNMDENRAIDEIRIGTSPASVMQGTKPVK